jgi:prepilin signal peptidase PulO-like enzyme (type II secretory pathway)
MLDSLPGIIWSFFIGIVMGNFATSPIYRLPKGEPLFARNPYCGSCNAPLTPRDLFPVFSWLLARGKCRYCDAAIPADYFFIELASGIIFFICYLKFGFSEPFILISFGILSLFMLAMMLRTDHFFSDRTLMVSALLGMLYRTLMDGTLYGFAGTTFAGILAGALAWKLSGKPMKRDYAAFPVYLKLLALAGIWLYFPQLAALLVIVFLAVIMLKRWPHIAQKLSVELVIIAAAILLLLLR